jgi:nucleotide-binding universal stress UspA family protein
VYKKVLVPLDGSKLAEIALPHVEEVAKGCSIPQVVLVTVTEAMKVQVPTGEVSEQTPEKGFRSPMEAVLGSSVQGRIYMADSAPLQKVPAVVGRMARAAKNYLAKMAEDMTKRGFATTTAVLVGDPVKELVRFADEEGADLIVMASWGQHGLSKWSVANVAEKVFRRTRIPMMLVKPAPGFKETKPRRKGKPV